MNYLWELTKEKEIKKRGETGNRQKREREAGEGMGRRGWGKSGGRKVDERGWRRGGRRHSGTALRLLVNIGMG